MDCRTQEVTIPVANSQLLAGAATRSCRRLIILQKISFQIFADVKLECAIVVCAEAEAVASAAKDPQLVADQGRAVAVAHEEAAPDLAGKLEPGPGSRHQVDNLAGGRVTEADPSHHDQLVHHSPGCQRIL